MAHDERRNLPAWLVAHLDQEEASSRALRQRSRDAFLQSLQRSGASPDEVERGMQWFDNFRQGIQQSLDVHRQDPRSYQPDTTPKVTGPSFDEAMLANLDPDNTTTEPEPAEPTAPPAVPRGKRDRREWERNMRPPRPARPPRAPRRDPEPIETAKVHKTRFEYELPPPPKAPGKSTRMLHSPAIIAKALAIGAVIGGAVWLALTALAVYLLDAAWWGWWPSLVTVPIAGIVFLSWVGAAFSEIRHWLNHGGREPLRPRPRFK